MFSGTRQMIVLRYMIGTSLLLLTCARQKLWLNNNDMRKIVATTLEKAAVACFEKNFILRRYKF